MSHYPPAIRRICVFVFCLSLALTLGQGILRFHKVLGVTGQPFIQINEADARVHATLAQRLLNGDGYTVPNENGTGSQPAFEKAPGYPFLLAMIFRVTGFGFWFFPLQSLLAGFLCVLVVLVASEAFSDPAAALFAGVGAAVHPVLVNAASQLYNEDIYFFLFFLCVWLFLRWHRHPSFLAALACGVCAGITALVRESILAPFACLILLTLVWGWRENWMNALKGALTLGAGLVLVVLPWTIHNYIVTGGAIVPISTISMYLVGAGNNDCVAADGWNEPFFGDNPCPLLNDQKTQLLAAEHLEPQTLNLSRASSKIGISWILNHPGEYLKLSFRRAWTVFDPWHKRQHLAAFKKLVFLVYFVLFVFTGITGLAWIAVTHRWTFPSITLALLLLTMYAPLVLIFVSHDHRFAIGIHLVLACFGGAWLAHFSFAKPIRDWSVLAGPAKASIIA